MILESKNHMMFMMSLDVHTNVLKAGDSYARSKIPWLDMLESCNIIRQALEKDAKIWFYSNKTQTKSKRW